MDKASALYYTFSTIAQALAAGIALLGAFVLYRLQSLPAEIQDAAQMAAQLYYPNSEVDRLLAEEDYPALVKFFGTNQPSANGESKVVNPYYDHQRRAFPALVALRKQLHYLLKVSLSLTVFVIAASAVVLATTPLIAASSSISCTVLGAGVVLFVACLICYALLISKAVYRG